jgi:hypothetical protein
MNKPFLLGLLRPEDGINTVFGNGCRYLPADTASYGKRLESSAQLLSEPETSQAFRWLRKPFDWEKHSKNS